MTARFELQVWKVCSEKKITGKCEAGHIEKAKKEQNRIIIGYNK